MPPLEHLKLGHRGPPTERNLKPKSARGFRDAYRAAKLVIDQRGEEPATYAGGRADLLLEEGDPEGSAV
jgi:hypothetical protein